MVHDGPCGHVADHHRSRRSARTGGTGRT
uniref:Uncharacterized protein n=1 Tax=Arundo donax TaxID=35708 RepID=A0A0A8XN92_ARUDO